MIFFSLFDLHTAKSAFLQELLVRDKIVSLV